MATSTTSRHIANPYLRWLVYLALAGLGVLLFVVCGMAGGMAALNWLG